MVILDVKGVFDMTEYKSIQELLNILCSCIVVDDSGQSYIRTKASSVKPDPGPDPDPGPSPTFTSIAKEYEALTSSYNQYLRNNHLTGICSGLYDNVESLTFKEALQQSAFVTVKFKYGAGGILRVADVLIKNENGEIYLQTADTLNWFDPKDKPFQIKCGHLLAIRVDADIAEYTTSKYIAPKFTVGTKEDSCFAYLLGDLYGLINGAKEGTSDIYYNLFARMFEYSPRLVYTNVRYPNIIGQDIYNNMFANCTSLKTANLYIGGKPAPDLNCTGFAESIFDGCSTLDNLNLKIYCVNITPDRMFKNAFNNTNITALDIIRVTAIQSSLTSEDMDYPLYNWLGGASNRTGTIKKQQGLSLTENSDSGIPTNWTIIN